MFRHEERVPYQQLKLWALDAYYDFCRDSGLIDRWSHEQVLTRVAYTFEDGLRPIENLMWWVILVILSGGWHPDWEASARKGIAAQIAEHGLENLLADVPQEEAELFKHDLTILKLI